jgi:hypothetical protein
MVALDALAQTRPLDEFVRDPALTVACVLLIVVSIAWVVVARMIWVNLRRAAANAERMARPVRRPRARDVLPRS